MSSVSGVGGFEGLFEGLEVVVQDTGTTRIVCPSGEIDLATAPAVDKPLTAGLVDGFETVVLDLRQTTFIDSTGIAMVHKALGRARDNGRRFIVLPGPPTVHRVFEVCGLADDMPFDSEHR